MVTRLPSALVVCLAIACTRSEPTYSGPLTCPAPAPGQVSYGCALVTGLVVGPDGQPLDGISAAVRATDACGCNSVAIPVDSLGLFSITVQRTLQRAATAPDTSTVVIYAGATAAKYPRSVTGDPFFDTTSVQLSFAAVGAVAAGHDVRLRIPLPSR